MEAERQSDQLRTTLIDAMAHEFKTPLTLIKGATTSVLSSREPLSESAREQLTIASEEAEHLRELLDNAIEMARLDPERIDVHLVRSDLKEIVQEVIDSMRTEIGGRPMQIASGEGIPMLPLDRRLIRLALKQLVDNALKYSPADLPVKIGIRADASSVTVEVTDSGPGIAVPDQGRIFEKFYRGRAVRDRIPGFGIGLTVAHAILLAHRGDLTLSSRPGETSFQMIFPAEVAAGVEP
jgi:signal transduction histidine kinase